MKKIEEILAEYPQLESLSVRIFQELPEVSAETWGIRLLNAITSCSDLSNVWNRFALFMLGNAEHGVINFADNKETRSAMQRIVNLYERSYSRKIFRIRWKFACVTAYLSIASSVRTGLAVYSACRAAACYAYPSKAALYADIAVDSAEKAFNFHHNTIDNRENYFILLSNELIRLLEEEK